MTNEILSSRYGSAIELVRDALAMEERKSKLGALRAHLSEGAMQAKQDEFVDDFSLDSLINDLDTKS
jgi:antitoxin ParD1/3/4